MTDRRSYAETLYDKYGIQCISVLSAFFNCDIDIVLLINDASCDL